MVDQLRWKPVFIAYQCGSVEEVLRLRLWSHDGWRSFRLALHLITFIASSLSLMWYVISFSFLQPYLSFLHPSWGPLMYSFALLAKSHELWTYRLIFFVLVIITSSLCLLHSIIFTFSSLSGLSLLVVTLYILFTWNVDSSHINAQSVIISPLSFHHLALIQRFQLESLSHGMEFHVFVSNLRGVFSFLLVSHWSKIY